MQIWDLSSLDVAAHQPEVLSSEEEGRAIAINPREALAWFNLGNAHLVAGDAAGAIPHYERAAELEPGIALAHFYLGRARAAGAPGIGRQPPRVEHAL